MKNNIVSRIFNIGVAVFVLIINILVSQYLLNGIRLYAHFKDFFWLGIFCLLLLVVVLAIFWQSKFIFKLITNRA